MERRSDTSPMAHGQPDQAADGPSVEPIDQQEHSRNDDSQRAPEPPEASEAAGRSSADREASAQSPASAEQGDEPPNERTARTGTLALTLALVSALLVSGLLLALSNVTRLPAGNPPGRTTIQVTPSPTLTVLPTPTTEPGFQLYVDHADGFLMQYPVGWTASAPSSGIEFTDGSNDLGYEVQVALPDPTIAQGHKGAGAQSAFWITYEFNILTQQGFTLTHQLGCSAPYTQPIVIGGVHWTCGVAYVSLVGVTPTPNVTPTVTPNTVATAIPTATVTATTSPGATTTTTPARAATPTPVACGNATCIQVVVLATVYQGRPYIINLLTSSDRFAAGNIEYFQPMLNTFAFLPTT